MGSDLQGSLLAYAIVLYSRSASDGDRGRRHTFNFSNILPAERLITHNAILKLRKTAIAHLDERGRQQWASDHALLVVHEDGAWEYGFTFSRTLVVEALCKDFLSLLEYVAPALGKLLEAENEQVHAALSAAVGADPALFAILTSQVFDQANFYGERAEEFAGAIRESGSHLVRNVGPIVKGQ
ncbi:MAG: hypothetical protein JF588_17170 [Caulobacterales bacterium]|nr:hypothetical protein [Caulobacterales bacterium]